MKMMKLSMSALIRKQHKIFKAIVIPYSVYMVNGFFGAKVSSNMLFHYKTMFSNVTHVVTKRVIRTKDIHIPKSSNVFPILPMRIIFTSSTIRENALNCLLNFLFCFKRMFKTKMSGCSYHSLIGALSTTIFTTSGFKSMRLRIKYFAASLARSLYHSIHSLTKTFARTILACFTSMPEHFFTICTNSFTRSSHIFTFRYSLYIA